MAEILDCIEILKVFKDDASISDSEDDLIRQCDSSFTQQQRKMADQNEGNDVNRSVDGAINPVVGDVGTCKTNCAAMARSSSYC